MANKTMHADFDQPGLAAGVLVTLEPLPFANAEGPLKVLASDHSSARHTGPTGHLGEAQAPSVQTALHAHSPSKGLAAPGRALCLPVVCIAQLSIFFLGLAKLVPIWSTYQILPVCPQHDPIRTYSMVCTWCSSANHVACSNRYASMPMDPISACDATFFTSSRGTVCYAPHGEMLVFSKHSLPVSVPRTCPEMTD